jgi:hypothetical protein
MAKPKQKECSYYGFSGLHGGKGSQRPRASHLRPRQRPGNETPVVVVEHATSMHGHDEPTFVSLN